MKILARIKSLFASKAAHAAAPAICGVINPIARMSHTERNAYRARMDKARERARMLSEIRTLNGY